MEVPVVVGSAGVEGDVVLMPVVVVGDMLEAVWVFLEKLQMPRPTIAAKASATMRPVLPIPLRLSSTATGRPVLSIRSLLFGSSMCDFL